MPERRLQGILKGSLRRNCCCVPKVTHLWMNPGCERLLQRVPGKPAAEAALPCRAAASGCLGDAAAGRLRGCCAERPAPELVLLRAS